MTNFTVSTERQGGGIIMVSGCFAASGTRSIKSVKEKMKIKIAFQKKSSLLTCQTSNPAAQIKGWKEKMDRFKVAVNGCWPESTLK